MYHDVFVKVILGKSLNLVGCACQALTDNCIIVCIHGNLHRNMLTPCDIVKKCSAFKFFVETKYFFGS